MNTKKISLEDFQTLALIFLFIGCCSTQNPSKKQEDIMKKRIQNSKNFKDGKFHNLGNIDALGSTWKWPMWKEFLFGDQIREPKKSPPYIKLDKDFFKGTRKQNLRITWLGHSSVIIEIEGRLILADPIFSPTVSSVPIFGPKRFHKEFPLKAADIPEIDLIIISHNHYDHLDKDTILSLHKKTKVFCAPLAVGKQLAKWGVPWSKIKEFDWWQEEIFSGIKIIATPAQHFSGRGLFDWHKTLWTSWVIQGKKHKVFFSGDSGYFPGFKEVGKRFGPFNVTLIESGQYSKYWPLVHMNPENAIQAHIDLNGKIFLPIHWGAFNLSIHQWTEPVEWGVKEAKKRNITITTPRAGESLVYKNIIPKDHWWPKYNKQAKVMEKMNVRLPLVKRTNGVNSKVGY